MPPTDLTVLPDPADFAEPSRHDAFLMTLTPYSDGREWDERTVVREILHYAETIIVSAYEIGRRLVWAKKVIGHGGFADWCAANVRISLRSAQEYMQVAEFLTENPRLLKPCGSLGLKKTLLLTTLAPDQVERLLGERGGMPETDIEGLDEVPYYELKRQVDSLKKTADKATGDLRAKEELLSQRNEELLNATSLSRMPGDAMVMKRLDERRKQLTIAFGVLGAQLDMIQHDWAEYNSATRAEVYGMLEWAIKLGELERLRFRMNIGEEVWGHEWAELLDEARPAASRFPLPIGRVPAARD